ncbi:MAG: HEAT repeat domain-containing protein [Candidatus Sumerlaeia bacterium]|nr:HEAT repeat domain-containing protein [Candidatus Sumerlaeia bacterium]
MSRRKSPAHSDAPSPTGRVDDVLVRSVRVRNQTLKLLAEQPVEDLSVQQTRALARRIQRRGPHAIQALFDCLFDEEDPNRQHLAIMLLIEMKDAYVQKRIHQLLQRPDLPERVRVALLAVEALSDESLQASPSVGHLSEISLDSLIQFTDSFWESMEVEEIAMMWSQHFLNEPPAERLRLIEMLMKSAKPKMLGIAYIELIYGDTKILQFLAEKLGMFNDPMAVGLLESLLDNPDLMVRTNADRSLARIRQRRTLGPPPESDLLPRDRFYRAYIVSDPLSGHYSLVYAVKSPNGLIKFLVALLNRWDRGVTDCWGCVRYTIEEFNELIATMSRDFADLNQSRIPKRTAQTFLYRAMELNQRRGYAFPPEFSVWSNLFIKDAFTEDERVPEFGPDCSLCQKPLRVPSHGVPWVIGDLVICPACSRRSLRCPACGGRAKPADCLVTQGNSRDDEKINLRCPHCFEVLPLPPRNTEQPSR